jgi:hypothetical protein
MSNGYRIMLSLNKKLAIEIPVINSNTSKTQTQMMNSILHRKKAWFSFEPIIFSGTTI